MSESVARIAVTLLCAAAVVAMIAVLGGSDTMGRRCSTWLSRSPCSASPAPRVCGLRRAGLEVVTYVSGYLTIAISAIAFGKVVSTVWSADWFFGGNAKTAAQLTLATIAAANVSLLLSTERVEDGMDVRAARAGGVLSIVVLTILAIVETSKPGQDVGIKPMAVFAILYVLCAALIPLLRRADLEQR